MKITKIEHFQPVQITLETEEDVNLLASILTCAGLWVSTRDKGDKLMSNTFKGHKEFIKEIKIGLGLDPGLL